MLGNYLYQPLKSWQFYLNVCIHLFVVHRILYLSILMLNLRFERLIWVNIVVLFTLFQWSHVLPDWCLVIIQNKLYKQTSCGFVFPIRYNYHIQVTHFISLSWKKYKSAIVFVLLYFTHESVNSFKVLLSFNKMLSRYTCR